MKKLLLAVALAALVSGCGSRDSATPAPAATDAQQPAAAAPAAGTPASSEAALKQAATAAQESAGAGESAGDAALERIAAMPESAQLPSGRWKAGTHYLPIVPAQNTSAEPGQVEVIEVMWLGCPHCYDFEPHIEAWRKKKPEWVKFSQEGVMWGPAHRGHAKLFYTLEALGRSDLVMKAFEDIHRRDNFLVAASDAQTQQMQVKFAKANGLAEADFLREYNGFGVNARLQRAELLSRRYRIESVPRIIINGKYETNVEMAGGHAQLLQLIDDLAASEKRR